MSEKGGGSPPESPHLSHAEITQLWAKFRAGEVTRCPRDSAGMALAGANVKKNVAPSPGAPSAQMRPPWRCTIR